MRKRRVIARVVAAGWIASSAMFLLGLSVVMFTQPKFPLNFGLVRTIGLEGLWATLVPGVAGLAGVALVLVRRAIGAGLILAYSAYWTVLLASGSPAVWNARSSFCLNGLGVCVTIPWVGRAVLIFLVAAFALTGLWSLRLMRAGDGLR